MEMPKDEVVYLHYYIKGFGCIEAEVGLAKNLSPEQLKRLHTEVMLEDVMRTFNIPETDRSKVQPITKEEYEIRTLFGR